MPYLASGQYDATARADLRRKFESAQPFPHVVLDNFLAADEQIVEHFPGPDWGGWLRYDDDYQRGKLCANDLSAMPQPFQQILVEMNSRPFLVFLEELTGIEGLIPDPYLEGGGLHSSGPGGVLQPHTDFHFYERLNVFRRVNALLYLNPDWRDEDGGGFGLFDEGSDAPESEISPAFGRLVVFRTDDKSVHGFTRPVAEGRRRKSIANVLLHDRRRDDVQWRRQRVLEATLRRFRRGRLRFGVYRALLRASRTFSVAAHLESASWSALASQRHRVLCDARACHAQSPE